MTDPDSIYDFADRAFREALEDVDNLREMVRRVLGPTADALDFSQRRMLPRDFLLPNWKGRERDFLCEIPFRISGEERWALVCILIEHQTRPDSRMPLRTLIYTVFYWEKCLRAWEASPGPRAEFCLPPVVPMVIHASPRIGRGSAPWRNCSMNRRHFTLSLRAGSRYSGRWGITAWRNFSTATKHS
jgi:Putative transposase, YhgA-like